MTESEQIELFLESGPYAVVGASRDRSKYGNKVLRVYLQNKLAVFPVNPNADEVEGLICYPDLAALPEKVRAISIITPPDVTEKIIEQAGQLGIQHAWLQPGAESRRAVQRAVDLGMNVISGGPCILVALRYHER